jgi:hypothetical protein
MELKQLVKTLDIDRETDWHTAKYLSVCSALERSEVDASVIYSALKGTQVIDIADRQGIVAGIANAKRLTGWKSIPVTLGTIDWVEAPDERSWTEKTADWQASLKQPTLRTKASYAREERAWRAYAGYSL